MNTPIQKILFGSPGTGKSYRVDKIISSDMEIYVEKTPENVIKTVFHPEYTYGDFVGKLMPISNEDGKVKYSYYEGHFLKALAQAYKNLLKPSDKDGEDVVLVIDEINRGNSAAIFGNIFQLLDREKNGWSNYQINISEMEIIKLLELIGVSELGQFTKFQLKPNDWIGNLEILPEKIALLHLDLKNRTIKIPKNLSIIATMNTSDSSIYYMDSAFKRRWDWEFIGIDGKPVKADGIAFNNREEWEKFVKQLNIFIKGKHKHIRGIEDKQVGYRFINTLDDERIAKSTIQNKLMFFIWDNVFNRDKEPLIKLMKSTNDKLITFGDFAEQVDMFIKNIQEKY
ncbi:MAG: AAA family ATPase [Candidatus Marithrix sp.]